jgi:hypothetical protein
LKETPWDKKPKEPNDDDADPEPEGEFGELLKFTLVGYLGGLGLGYLLDRLGYATSALGGFFVRTLSGEGDGIFEGFYSLRQRFRKARSSMAEAYGWGKILGVLAGGIIDLLSRLLGVNIDGIEGFYIPYFYAMSDQIGASISGFVYLKRKKGDWGRALRTYVRHPVMMTSLLVLLLVPVALLAARMMGFSPTTQVYAAVETIAANVGWLPPLVGWLSERRKREA